MVVFVLPIKDILTYVWNLEVPTYGCSLGSVRTLLTAFDIGLWLTWTSKPSRDIYQIGCTFVKEIMSKTRSRVVFKIISFYPLDPLNSCRE